MNNTNMRMNSITPIIIIRYW